MATTGLSTPPHGHFFEKELLLLVLLLPLLMMVYRGPREVLGVSVPVVATTGLQPPQSATVSIVVKIPHTFVVKAVGDHYELLTNCPDCRSYNAGRTGGFLPCPSCRTRDVIIDGSVESWPSWNPGRLDLLGLRFWDRSYGNHFNAIGGNRWASIPSHWW